MTTKVTFMGFLLAVSTLSVSATNTNAQQPTASHTTNNIEYRLLRITKAIQKQEIETINTLPIEDENLLVRGFANRGGGGGFVNRGGGGFVNRSPFRNGGGGFVNSGGGGFVNRSPFRNGGGFYNRY
ncbi:GrrA/OscA1 family cyclophane-containing rSAM-modified RiPP [Crocosphaera sp. Alani8]|uniref:GrrA/OscA1 family cyclophane-containing rSAM-modified RiPP n=1 Tax=Crocosphaera sp. Alani8 TaxID=3038952 RepID=UPI00313B8155